uniref:Uncharacterized protein n=1 Tax=Romanomermis culicivorax TaxID=13658 RepID=A0A915JXL3_ROMCU
NLAEKNNVKTSENKIENCINFRSEQCTATNDIEFFYLNDESSTKNRDSMDRMCSSEDTTVNLQSAC